MSRTAEERAEQMLDSIRAAVLKRPNAPWRETIAEEIRAIVIEAEQRGAERQREACARKAYGLIDDDWLAATVMEGIRARGKKQESE